ncbi:MAG TPA: cation-translocating P-type ATPase, partial [Burkholderiales bacterium]|nr:cation-translocating P-type ATPase [Burkholderiales bacterium]
YIVAVHVPTAGMAFAPLLFGWPLVLFPLHIVFLEFVIDPACSIAYEAEPSDARTMGRPPRAPGARLFDARMLWSSVALGAMVLGAVLALYAWALHAGRVEVEARTIAFAAIVIGNLALIFACRPTLTARNAALWWIVAGAVAALAVAIYWPPAAALFHFAPLGV